MDILFRRVRILDSRRSTDNSFVMSLTYTYWAFNFKRFSRSAGLLLPPPGVGAMATSCPSSSRHPLNEIFAPRCRKNRTTDHTVSRFVRMLFTRVGVFDI